MKFFNVDLHISVIADMKRIFSGLGHQVDDLCLSGHHWVMNRKQDHVAELSSERWTKLVWNWDFDSFYKAHKASLSKYDGFVVTYPPIFAMLYEKFDKPIIINIPIRYDYSVHGCPERLGKWNEWLKKGVASGQVILVANNKYDVEYCKALSGLIPQHIPSLCEYFPVRDVRPRGGFVLYEDGCSLSKWVPEIRDRKQALPRGWKWPGIHTFKAVAHLPYQVSTMSVFEQYTANVPMVLPTPRLLSEMYFTGWNVLSQVSTFQLSRAKPNKSIVPIVGELDPNDHTSKDVVDKLWLPNADFYDQDWMRHIVQYDNGDDLKKVCASTDFDAVSEAMRVHNKERIKTVYGLWENILEEVECRS